MSRDPGAWWTLPLYVAVGLLGAVLAGSLAVVYYSQQVAGLERETAGSRAELAEAVETVNEATDEALETIDREVAAALDRVAAESPLDDPIDAGVVAVRAVGPDGDGGSSTRRGSGFVVVTTEDASFVLTSFAVVADPDRDGSPVEEADLLVAGEVVGAEVHAWDPDRELALLRTTPLHGIGVADWRPTDEPIDIGDHVFLVGLTPNGSLLTLRATVGAADEEALFADVALPEVLRGGPVLDASGRVVAVGSGAYAPWGGSASAAAPHVPIRLSCEQVIRCGEEDLGAG